MSLRVLLVSEGSGGHLIPALQVARELAEDGAKIQLWYVERRQTERLTRSLLHELNGSAEAIEPHPVRPAGSSWARLWRCQELWKQSQRCFDTFDPHVVVGFGGWMSAPVLAAARRRGIECLVHEQNVQLGRANRVLTRWVDCVAISFSETRSSLNGTPSVVTGLPVRRDIGSISRTESAARLGVDAARPTVLVLGGSQGSRAINETIRRLVPRLTDEERRSWQFLHITGSQDEAGVRAAYADSAHSGGAVRAIVMPFLADMGSAYAAADLAVTRAGASTIAELAQCGLPAIVIPYPFAGGHQRVNARLVESVGGAVMLEEAEASAERLLGTMRRILRDRRLRAMMGEQMRSVARPHAAASLASAIRSLHLGSDSL